MPRTGAGNEAATGRPLAASHPGFHLRQTILLVEDEVFVRKVAIEILSAAGYAVLSAGNAAEALRKLHSHRGALHLLLTDVVLPDRSGCDLAMEISNLVAGVKAILISGYPENSVTRNGLPYQDWSYLPKPFSASSLIQKVRESLSHDNSSGTAML
ncbi:MAG TPA: response regulator [Terriglobales bacterium]|nr:response regulator [Terriglobales bacterium]